jgi:succinyl-diaminopimelate desuccinylase
MCTVPGSAVLSGRIDAPALVELAGRLVREPSVHAPALGRDEAAAAGIVAEAMAGFGWRAEVEEFAPGRPNVVAVIEGGLGGPSLLFEGHTDVVTEGDAAAWSFPPFAGDVVDGRLRGRGSADMKGGVAAMLHAAAALRAGGAFPGRVVLAALADEEGMMSGAKAFVASGRAVGIDGAIVCEPEAGEVCVAQKGALRLLVEVEGKMAHGAMPDQGRNPIPALAAVLGAIAAEERWLRDVHGEHALLGWPSLTPTVLRAGEAEQLNVIPSRAWCGIDVRSLPGIDHGALVERLRGAASFEARRHGVTARVEVLEDRPATEIDTAHPLVEAVAAAHEEVTGRPRRFGGVPGTTDGTILWRDAGVPVVVYGPGGKWIAHQVDEYVAVEELVTCAEVYLRAAERFLWGGAGLEPPPAAPQ